MAGAVRRPARRRRTNREQGGFTLIEFVVTLSLITIGVFGYMQVFYGGMRLSLAANVRTRATALASQEVESIRAVPYDAVAMDASLLAGPNYTDSDTIQYPYVTGGTTAPTGTSTTSGTTYSVSRAIVWAAVGSNVTAYKRAIVNVTWTDRAGSHRIRQDAYVYPGGLGPASSTTTTTAAPGTTTTTAAPTLSAPTGLTATTNGLQSTSEIDLSWTAGSVVGTTWEVQHSLTSDFASVTVDTTVQPIGSPAYAKTGLAASTTFYFRVRTVTSSATGPWSTVLSATTTAPVLPACAVGTANVTPSGVNKANNGNGTLADPLNVTVSTSGACSGLKLSFKPNSGSSTLTAALTSTSGGVWSLAIGTGTYSWDVGNKVLTVLDGANTQLASISLLVCAKGNHCP